MPSLRFRWRILAWTKGDFRGSLYWGKYWECYFQGSSCEIWQISMEFLCFRGHYILWGIITLLREPLRDLGKSQWSSFTWGVYEGITVRFGKISMEFLHLVGLWGNHCEIWENLNGVPSLWGFIKESYSCLKGASDEYSHGPMRSTVWGIKWGKLTHGQMGLCRADLGKSEEKWCTHLVQGNQW